MWKWLGRTSDGRSLKQSSLASWAVMIQVQPLRGHQLYEARLHWELLEGMKWYRRKKNSQGTPRLRTSEGRSHFWSGSSSPAAPAEAMWLTDESPSPSWISDQHLCAQLKSCFKPLTFDAMCMHAKSLQLCPTLWKSTDYCLPGSSLSGILQARILVWGAMPSSRASSWPRDRPFISSVSCVGM